jgi:hypothetical protein
LKASPLWGLAIASIGLAVVIFRVFVKKKKADSDNVNLGGDLNKIQ